MSELLTIKDLTVVVGGRRVLDRVQMTLRAGEVVAIVGANGAGKSSLAQAMMGHPQSVIESGTALFDGKNLIEMAIDERAKQGLYVAWQNPVAIPGVSVFALCKAAYEASGKKIGKLASFKEKVEELAGKVGLTKDFVKRGVNEDFSGGEKKRLELLLILLLQPKLVILDEIDSGLDAKGRELVLNIIKNLAEKGSAFVVITHYEQMVGQLGAATVLEMKNGRLLPRFS